MNPSALFIHEWMFWEELKRPLIALWYGHYETPSLEDMARLSLGASHCSDPLKFWPGMSLKD